MTGRIMAGRGSRMGWMLPLVEMEADIPERGDRRDWDQPIPQLWRASAESGLSIIRRGSADRPDDPEQIIADLQRRLVPSQTWGC